MRWTKKRDKSLDMSLPPAKALYGVKITKLPIARYLTALNTLERLPAIIAEVILPEAGGASGVMEKLLTNDKVFWEQVLFRVLTLVPQELCSLLSELLDIPVNRLLDVNSENPLSLKELTDILLAFWDMNDLTDFFANVRRLQEKLTARTSIASTGSSAG